MILVSACLLGHKVKYNGGSNDDTLLQAYNAQGRRPSTQMVTT